MAASIEEATLSDSDLEEQAYKQANKDTTILTAYFYRKDITVSLIEVAFDEALKKHENYLPGFINRAVQFFLAAGKNPKEQDIKEFIGSEEEIARNLGAYIHKVIHFIIEEIAEKIQNDPDSFNEASISTNIKAILDENAEYLSDVIANETRIAVYEQFYEEDYKKLSEGGMVYALPNGKHKWSYNAAWLLGHFHKGTNTFVIKSPIDEDGHYRGETSDYSGELGSGFFREVAVALMFGYRLEIRDNEIVLYHDNPAKLARIQLQDITRIRIEEMIPIYGQAIAKYTDLEAQIKLQQEKQLQAMLEQATEQLKTTSGPITSWSIQTKKMPVLQADSLVKILIKNKIPGSVIKIVSTVGQDNSSFIRVLVANPEEINKVWQILKAHIHSVNETRPLRPSILRKFGAVEVPQHGDPLQALPPTLMFAGPGAAASAPLITTIRSIEEVKSTTMNEQTAHQLQQALIRSGIDAHLIDTTFNAEVPDSYQIIIRSDFQQHIQIAKRTMQDMGIAIANVERRVQPM